MADEEVLNVDAKNLTASLKSQSMNTLITLLVAVGVGVLVWQGFTHSQESRDAGVAFVAAIKEQTAAIKDQTSAAREGNCLSRFSDAEKRDKADFCRQIAR